MSTRVRAGLAADAASLAAIRASVAASDPEASAGTPQGGSPGPDYFARWLEKERGLIYVAEIGGAAAGYLAMQQAAHPAVAARHPVQLCQLYVIPALHGGGVAALLMSAALEQARMCGNDVIWLGVSEHNLRARGFYRKHGFVAVAVHEVGDARQAHRDVVMSRPLAG